jgi:hypothetical protein
MIDAWTAHAKEQPLRVFSVKVVMDMDVKSILVSVWSMENATTMKV